MVREWIDGMAPDQLLFEHLERRRTWLMVRKDLERVGIPYQTEEGIADFHAAGRHSHVTELLRSGASLPEARELARHADVRTTMKYTHIGMDDRAKALRNLRWQRIGSPGLIKPDLVAFGGCDDEPFYAFDQTLGIAVPHCGTSFASPYALRMGMGIRAHFGTLLSTLAIKALLVHCTEPAKKIPAQEIGWGRLPERLEDFVVCPDGVARVVYQGELTPAQYLRTPIPLPTGPLQGMVSIAATFCFACETDPQDPSNYTRGGLDITFSVRCCSMA
jgi:hypothetical protein